MKEVTNGDIGGQGGLKFSIFVVTSFLNSPLHNSVSLEIFLPLSKRLIFSPFKGLF